MEPEIVDDRLATQETHFSDQEEKFPLLIDNESTASSSAQVHSESKVEDVNEPLASETEASTQWHKWRNYIGFWLLGISNNFPYVVMLSSAYDILDNLKHSPDEPDELYNSSCTLYINETTNSSMYTPRECLEHGTYLILLADILPTFLIKLTLPYCMHHIPYWIRVVCVVLFAAASFIIVALAQNIPTVLVGVVCASISAGLGEITFLALTARYNKLTVAGWSSGTGAAGVGGALAYTAFSSFLSPRNSLFIQLVVPAIMLLSYMFLITKPQKIEYKKNSAEENESASPPETTNNNTLTVDESSNTGKRRFKFELYRKSELSVVDHLKFIPKLFAKYMIWLFLVYVAEYMINHSLFESLYYPNTRIGKYCLKQNVQYKWYQVMYQIGVFISRSSLILFHFKFFHVLSLLQVLNFILLFLEVIFQVVPFFWITLFFVLYEGLLGGGVYANAFYSISKNVEPAHREFSMGLASVADSTGIAVAGLLSYFIHEYICSLGY